MNFETLNTLVHMPDTEIIDTLGLPPCQAALDILTHLKAIRSIIDSDN